MSEFRPIYSAHAIERCAVSVAFDGALPDKLFANCVNEITAILEQHGMKRDAGSPAFQIDQATGRVISVSEDYAPATFTSFDNAFEIVIMPNSIMFSTQRYVRWASFVNAFHNITAHILARFDTVLSYGSLRLEYWDRFLWTGEWDSFDLRKLLKTDTGLVSSAVFEAERECHSHIGWFEYREDQRRLYNVNVDVLALVSPHNPTRVDPSAGIYILVHDQADKLNVRKFAESGINGRLEDLHKASKAQLSSLLVANLAKRIGLGG
nr:TIGR04255 family protein [Brucella anthropi]